MRRRSLLLAAAGSTALPAALRAQPAWPTRPITMVAPLAAGSSVDIVARTVADGWSSRLGQPVVTENRPAANGTLALGQVARAAPDGYTVTITGQTSIAFNPVLYPTLPYDPLRDFQPITRIVAVSNALVVKRGSAFNSVADIVAAGKANPGKLTYSSGGVGTTHHVSSAMFAQMTGFEATHVPYRGAPQGILAAQTGEVDFAFFNISTLLGLIRSGELKALAVTSATRSSYLPEVPTMQEAGVAGYEMSTWIGVSTVARTPAPIVQRMYEVTQAMMGDEAVRKRLTEIGFDLIPQPRPAEMVEIHKAEFERWGPILRAAGVRRD
ncbi:tripartite tricarboxylate transporter substrate binding protein [Roseomonas sp. AR75]|jgi:tripartite-type tricarboxylate transporter receptor subunit TctC|uniref:Bug family tripartite tricarboxylate transporter substrate binding protein n=1 Tax=Roseomonas sp. AR75 TaxID=2562311 RepID=UPI0010BF6968|nr:tripartite tricarboxylate transporter substrate binding protein [Roseomonas sp. AR75]